MILQGNAIAGNGVEYEFLRDSVESISFYSKNELRVNYKGKESETFYADDTQIHTMYLLNDEGKTLRVLWRQPVPERNTNPVDTSVPKKSEGTDGYRKVMQ